ncbi:MFS transporter [Brucella pseudogrignonensis]|uniref:MFS family permease n=1 Tax=Brucella pseudogrignonensis TaxID=419475 RepID=A0ABU1MBT2_9HYPH|nr:MFS transporter [Brucella pseudogrignonensis]MDR6433216.1 MFS family permease [Brucella pseudogrignonensis]
MSLVKEDGEGAACAATPSRPVWPLLASIAVLYASFGSIYGLMQGGLPPLMRARGIDLASIGWSFLMLVPFGLTFLWAPVIDAVRPMRKRPRIGWIVPMQAVIVCGLLVVAQGEHFPPLVLLTFGIVIAFAAATMDVALDALATASIPADQRTVVGGLKVAALGFGAILGGGVFVALSNQLGWTATFNLCAAVSALSTVPIIFSRKWDFVTEGTKPGRPSILAVLRQGAMRRRMIFLTLTTMSIVALSFLNRVMLVDLDVTVETIGWIVGIGAPVFGLLAALGAIPVVRILGSRFGVLIFTLICLFASGGMIIGALRHDTVLAISGAIVMSGGTSGLFVILSAATLGWADGPQPATDYAVLYGVSRLIATFAIIGLSNLVAVIGWSVYYVGASFALLVAALLLCTILPDLKRHGIDASK